MFDYLKPTEETLLKEFLLRLKTLDKRFTVEIKEYDIDDITIKPYDVFYQDLYTMKGYGISAIFPNYALLNNGIKEEIIIKSTIAKLIILKGFLTQKERTVDPLTKADFHVCKVLGNLRSKAYYPKLVKYDIIKTMLSRRETLIPKLYATGFRQLNRSFKT